MTTPSPLETSITTNGQGPAEAQGDAGRVAQHSLPDQIAADKYLAEKQAGRRKTLPIRLARLRPGGTT